MGFTLAVGVVSVVASWGFDSVAGVESEAGWVRGATGVGSSILGGFSSTLADVGASDLDLDLKLGMKLDKRFFGFETPSSFFSSLFSAF